MSVLSSGEQDRSQRPLVVYVMMSVGALIGFLVSAGAPQQPEYWPSGGACRAAPCGSLVDPARWDAAWGPWAVAAFLIMVSHLAWWIRAGRGRDRPPSSTLPGGLLQAFLTAVGYLLIAWLWRWTVELIAGQLGYHMGVSSCLASALVLGYFLSRRLPGTEFLAVRLLGFLLSYVYAALRIGMQVAYSLEIGRLRPLIWSQEPILYLWVFGVVLVSAFGCWFYCRMRSAGSSRLGA